MTDRELIEAAAKAAGVPLKWPHDPATYARVDGVPPRRTDTWDNWSPLTDDGDALRLAVALRITPNIDCNMTEAEAATQVEGGFFAEPHLDDPYAATRRAIVRAAAALAGAAPAEGGAS